jgi:hypothetical protein
VREEWIAGSCVDAQRIVATPVHRHLILFQRPVQFEGERVPVRANDDLLPAARNPEAPVPVIAQSAYP